MRQTYSWEIIKLPTFGAGTAEQLAQDWDELHLAADKTLSQ